MIAAPPAGLGAFLHVERGGAKAREEHPCSVELLVTKTAHDLLDVDGRRIRDVGCPTNGREPLDRAGPAAQNVDEDSGVEEDGTHKRLYP